MMPTNTARAWLADYLTEHGPTPSRTVKGAAAAAGIPERTLKRAAASLRLHYTASGYPRITTWTLPGAGPTGPTGPTDHEQGKRSGHRPLDREILRRIVASRAAGRSQQRIADDLNREGIPTAQRGIWRQQTIRRLLASPAADEIRAQLENAPQPRQPSSEQRQSPEPTHLLHSGGLFDLPQR